MSDRAVRWVLRSSGAKGLLRATLVTLADFYNDGKGAAWPSLATMVAADGLCAQTHRRNLRKAETDGLISIERRSGRSDRYRFPALELSTTGDSQAPLPGRPPVTLSNGPLPQSHPTGDSGEGVTVNKTKNKTKNPSRERTREAAPFVALDGAGLGGRMAPPSKAPERLPDFGAWYVETYQAHYAGATPLPADVRRLARGCCDLYNAGLSEAEVRATLQEAVMEGWGAGMLPRALDRVRRRQATHATSAPPPVAPPVSFADWQANRLAEAQRLERRELVIRAAQDAARYAEVA